jgi:hypothetical protein
VTDDGGKSWALAPISGSNPALHNSPAASLCITAAGIGLASGFGVSGNVILLSKDGRLGGGLRYERAGRRASYPR